MDDGLTYPPPDIKAIVAEAVTAALAELRTAVEKMPRHYLRYDPRSGTDRLFESSDGNWLSRAEVLARIDKAVEVTRS